LDESLRIDKWLWHARFCKTRAIAQEKAAQGHIRINGHRVKRQAPLSASGDIMTLPAGGRVIALKVLGLGFRRGPCVEAQKFVRANRRVIRAAILQTADGYSLNCLIASLSRRNDPRFHAGSPVL
jgi:ribosome-associated heat shock protein Hsp15